ncbi:DNA repair protein [Trypanosoma grayi]|uniref:DNA repair protein n=1 Tax=Trypanosoma grayi TaxID=71804 RepID=UPI0004F4A71C|nr:DNA repair protein [Trypanosoma grayi]KEG09287.1 DNA repair protein [Trypanosoma grayi]
MYPESVSSALEEEEEEEEDTVRRTECSAEIQITADPLAEQRGLSTTERVHLLLQQLQRTGRYSTDSQLAGVLLQPPCVIAQQTDASLEDVDALYRYIGTAIVNRTNLPLAPITVADFLTHHCRPFIPTGHECLDSALMGGIGCGLVTEITGATGAGKTAFALHLALHAASYTAADPRKARTLWITTDAAAFPAAAAVERVLQQHLEAQSKNGSSEEAEDALRDVTVALHATLAQLRAWLPALRRHLAQCVNVRLVVLDSFSTLVRRSFPGVEEEVAERHEAVAELLGILKEIAQEYCVAVVVTTLSGSELGHSFLHAVNTRLRLTQCVLERKGVVEAKEGTVRVVTHMVELVKSSVAAASRFECEFDGLLLRHVRLLDDGTVVMLEDAALCSVDPAGHVIVPTFVYC